nr:MAG TPA: hypothetical protein [Caudoviricetes sp.]
MYYCLKVDVYINWFLHSLREVKEHAGEEALRNLLA